MKPSEEVGMLPVLWPTEPSVIERNVTPGKFLGPWQEVMLYFLGVVPNLTLEKKIIYLIENTTLDFL